MTDRDLIAREVAKRICKCRLCIRHRRMDSLRKRGTRKQLVAALDELMNHLCDVEADLNYHQVIMDGSWPSSVEQLQKALKRARKVKHNAD